MAITQPRVMFIPRWVMTQLQREKQNPQVLLSLSRSMDFLSAEDLAIIHHISENSLKYFGYDRGRQDSISIWERIEDPDIENFQSEIQKYNNHVAPLLPLVEQIVHDRLFSCCNVADVYPTSASPAKPYEILVADATNYFVVVSPGAFVEEGGSAQQVRQQLNRELLSNLHNFMGFDLLARTPCFARHFETLSNAV